jgi:serine O-acetyltransferase
VAVNAVIRWHRRAQWLDRHQVPALPKIISRMTRIVFACDLPHTVEMGDDVNFLHNGLGVVIHPRVKIGRGTRILSNVTIGGNSRSGGVPEIGDGVYIGAGAVIIGPVVVGSGAWIGANAVVTKDVPEDHLALGIPAVTRPRDTKWADDPRSAG